MIENGFRIFDMSRFHAEDGFYPEPRLKGFARFWDPSERSLRGLACSLTLRAPAPRHCQKKRKEMIETPCVGYSTTEANFNKPSPISPL